MSLTRKLQHCCRAFGLALFLIYVAAPTVHAQIIYVSDNRSTGASVGIDTNAASLSLGGLATVTYSGDYTASGSPSSPYADFNSALNGTIYVSTAYHGVSNSYSANVYAQQVSSLGSQAITYSSTVQQSWNLASTAPFTKCSESSFLQVSFMVGTATPYELTLTRGFDTFFGPGTWTLSSANLGTLVDTPSGPVNSGQFSYSGIFTPGDVYTLTLRQGAGLADTSQGEIDTFQATLVVPEPKSSILFGMGALCLFFLRQWRKSGQHFRSAPAPARARSI
jgi:hypothetical protein